MKAPRRMLRYLGKMNAKSLEVAMELVEMLVPSVARPLYVSACSLVDEERRGLQSGSAEESTGSVVPLVDDLGRVPVECTIDCLTCRCDH
jgi:hypothetical protein